MCACLSSEGTVLCLRGWTDETGMQTLFLCRQSPSHTVNDFSTSFRVMDNQTETLGCVLALSFSLDSGGERRFLNHETLVVLCTFFHVGANVKRSTLGQSNDGFPLLAASLVSKEHSG